jgi:hypothetical protein
LNFTNCTFFQNEAVGGNGASVSFGYGGSGGDGFGGTLFQTNGSMDLVNCTVIQNVARGGAGGDGGGENRDGSPGNGYGSGFYVFSGSASLFNTILADPSRGNIRSRGHNLVVYTNGITGLDGSDLKNVAPTAGPLQDNGGDTWTCALLPGSPAIDGGSGVGAPELDQRGIARPFGREWDIGAVEYRVGAVALGVNEGRMRIQFLVEPNQSYPIQVTGEFVTWQDVGIVPASATGLFLFEDDARLPMQFYRLGPGSAPGGVTAGVR